MSNIGQLLAHSQRLQTLSDTAVLDVELLLCHCLDKPRSYLKAWPERELTQEQVLAFEQLLQRREKGEPIAYLTGSRGFWTLDLAVNSSTLIPRPETELLVELALEKLAENSSASILDLGTGTGAIALAIASEKPQWQVLASELQAEAMALAELNRQQHQLNNVQLIQSSWFDDIPLQQFDLIVSNPPYIDQQDPHLLQGDVRFEPRTALVAANKGLADIAHILIHAKAYLKPQAWLMFEHGYDQAVAVQKLMADQGYTALSTVKDLSGNDRVSMGRLA